MLTFIPFDTQADLQYHSLSPTKELNRILSAAVVSKIFRSLLLSDPQKALQAGYQGESFQLNEEDQNWLLSVRATSLVDLAVKLVTYQKEMCYDATELFTTKSTTPQPVKAL